MKCQFLLHEDVKKVLAKVQMCFSKLLHYSMNYSGYKHLCVIVCYNVKYKNTLITLIVFGLLNLCKL